MTLTLVERPELAVDNWWIVLLILVPCAIFLYLVVKNPAILFIDGYWGEEVHTLKTYKMSLSAKEQGWLEEYQRGM